MRGRLAGEGAQGRLDTVSADGSLTAHYENTILITDGEPEVLTRVED